MHWQTAWTGHHQRCAHPNDHATDCFIFLGDAMKTQLPEPAFTNSVVYSGIAVNKTVDENYYTESQLRAAMVAVWNEAIEEAASAIDPLEEWRGIDEKAYLIAVGIAKCIRELKKETP